MEVIGRCRNCGRDVAPGSRFCSHCGEAVHDLQPRAGTGLLPANRKLNGDRYLIVRKLAQGGQSAVYLVMDTANGQRCAIKEMSESHLTAEERDKAINAFLREATILSGLRNPGLCRVYGTFVEDGKHFLVMEYIEGHNLEDELIGFGRPLDWQRVAQWGIALADVLGYLHAQTPPIVYRDLKPANVMLTPNGVIKLIDFGIARLAHAQRTRDTARLGTDGYAPIEQYSGRSEPRSDLYALGATLYHLLTGRVPDPAPLRPPGQPLAPIRAVNPTVPESLERVIQQALNRDPQERFPNVLVMKQALEWAIGAAADGSARMRATYGAAAPGMSSPSGGPGRIGSNGRITGEVAPPRLRLWPLRLDIGLLEANRLSVQLLEVANRGGGHLAGITETNSSCLTVEPPQVSATTTQLQVRVNTTGLAPGEYVCHVAVRTNGGDQIVPVRFMVHPAGSAPTGGWGNGHA